MTPDDLTPHDGMTPGDWAAEVHRITGHPPTLMLADAVGLRVDETEVRRVCGALDRPLVTIIRATEACERYAAEHGITVADMTTAEKAEAFRVHAVRRVGVGYEIRPSKGQT